MREEVAKAVERAETLAIDHMPDGWPAVQMRDLTTMAQALRAQDAEIARLQNIADGNAELYQHELLRSEKADALLRELSMALGQGFDGYNMKAMRQRITAHLSENSRG